MFKRYQHIERYATDEVEGIDIGDCFIFYKLDGTNGSVWLENGIQAGSRNRHLTIEYDNQGFYNAMLKDENILSYLNEHPTHRLFGEWLIPHSLKTYRDDAWRKFYIFDVVIDNGEEIEYIPFDIYESMLKAHNLNYIPPLCKVKNPTYEILLNALEKSGQFLVKDGLGKGEGIVIKNYDFYNKYKRQTWAKIVTNEFKEKHVEAMGYTEITASLSIEEKILDKFVTESFIEKEFEKIKNELGWTSKQIPMLFGRVFHELIQEETWNILKEYKNPKIDFARLYVMVINKVKQTKKELFR